MNNTLAFKRKPQSYYCYFDDDGNIWCITPVKNDNFTNLKMFEIHELLGIKFTSGALSINKHKVIPQQNTFSIVPKVEVVQQFALNSGKRFIDISHIYYDFLTQISIEVFKNDFKIFVHDKNILPFTLELFVCERNDPSVLIEKFKIELTKETIIVPFDIKDIQDKGLFVFGTILRIATMWSINSTEPDIKKIDLDSIFNEVPIYQITDQVTHPFIKIMNLARVGMNTVIFELNPTMNEILEPYKHKTIEFVASQEPSPCETDFYMSFTMKELLLGKVEIKLPNIKYDFLYATQLKGFCEMQVLENHNVFFRKIKNKAVRNSIYYSWYELGFIVIKNGSNHKIQLKEDMITHKLYILTEDDVTPKLERITLSDLQDFEVDSTIKRYRILAKTHLGEFTEVFILDDRNAIDNRI